MTKRTTTSLVRTSVRAGVLIAVLATALTACTTTSTGGSSASSSQATDAVAQQAAERVKAGTAAPTWNGPTVPLDKAKIAGQTVVFVAADYNIPFNKQMSESFAEAATALGIKAVTIDGQGSPDNYVSAVQQAISLKATGLVLLSISPDLIAAPLEQARAAGIKVVSSANYTQGADIPSSIDSNVSVDFEKIGAYQVDYALSNSGESTDAIGFYAPQFPADVSQSEGQEKEFAALCPSCTFTRQTIQVTTFQQQLPAQVRSAVQSDTKLNWLLPTFDGLNLAIVPAVTQANAAGRVRSSSHNALEANLKYVEDGNVQAMSVGEDLGWWAWGQVDQIGRLMAGQAPVDQNIPVRIIDKSVLDAAGGPTSTSLFGGVDYRSEYTALWQ